MKLAYSELSTRLRQNLDPIYLLTGDQELLRDLAGKRIRQAAVGDEPTPFDTDRFDGERASAEEVVASANMLPLLGARRLVLVKRASLLLETDESFLAYAGDPSPRTVLVLDLEKKLDARRKAAKEIEKKCTVVVCDAPRFSELEDWVAAEAKARKLELGREDVGYLVAELGSDLRRIENELEKLSLYASGERLDPETIAEVLGRGRAQSVFKFLDAVAAGEAGSALRQLDRLLEEGEAPLRILALLDRLVGQLRMAREVQASGRRNANLASILGMPPSAARALADRARRLDRAFLKRAVVQVAECDRILKSSRLPERVVLESLTIALARGGALARGKKRPQAEVVERTFRESRDL